MDQSLVSLYFLYAICVRGIASCLSCVPGSLVLVPVGLVAPDIISAKSFVVVTVPALAIWLAIALAALVARCDCCMAL